jgi:hypothetical protein
MIEQIRELSFDQLRSLRREIAALIAQKRHEAVEAIKQQIEQLGLTLEDFAPPKKKRGRRPKIPDEAEPKYAPAE